MTLRMPVVQEGPHFTFACELEGVSYTFTFRWNDRDSAWFMEIGDGAGLALISGLRIVINILLLKALRGGVSGDLPPGDFIAIDTTGREEDAAFEDLGRRVQILYVTQDDIAAAG